MEKAKAKVRSSVKDMAKELIALYAKRMSTKGYAFSEDTDLQRDFELRFAYDETDDQLRSAAEIKGIWNALPLWIGFFAAMSALVKQRWRFVLL